MYLLPWVATAVSTSGKVRWALRVWSFWPGLAELEIKPQDVMPAAEWALQALRLEGTGRWSETTWKKAEKMAQIPFGVKVKHVKGVRLTEFGNFPILQSIFIVFLSKPTSVDSQLAHPIHPNMSAGI